MQCNEKPDANFIVKGSGPENQSKFKCDPNNIPDITALKLNLGWVSCGSRGIWYEAWVGQEGVMACYREGNGPDVGGWSKPGWRIGTFLADGYQKCSYKDDTVYPNITEAMLAAEIIALGFIRKGLAECLGKIRELEGLLNNG